MKRLMFLFGLVTAFIFLLSTSILAQAGNTKVEVCHIPPGNPANFHTIIVSENAVPAHLAHGDLLGACDSNAEELCNDDNPCTIDAIDPNTNACDNSQPTDCNDGTSCTNDSCDPASGCQNVPALDCESPDLCTLSVCNGTEEEPFCENTSIICDEGLECNPDTGDCEPPSSTGTISGTVFEDVNDNLVHDEIEPGLDEPGIANITVSLDCGGGFTNQATTDADGNYMFTGISTPATCTVELIGPIPSGFVDNCGIFLASLTGGVTVVDTADLCIINEGD